MVYECRGVVHKDSAANILFQLCLFSFGVSEPAMCRAHVLIDRLGIARFEVALPKKVLAIWQEYLGGGPNTSLALFPELTCGAKRLPTCRGFLVPRFNHLSSAVLTRLAQDGLTTLSVGVGPFVVPKKKLFLSCSHILISLLDYIQ
jgi:hypothetical protein